MYQTLDDLEKVQDSQRNLSKQRKGLKHPIIFFWILIALTLVLLWLSRNWFTIDILWFRQCWPRKTYNWKNANCYQKCMDWCSYKNCTSVMKWEQYCPSDCHTMCDVPRYKNCVSKCEKPNVEWYSEIDYKHWCGEKYDNFTCENPINVDLSQKQYYDEWIDEVFGWYKEDFREYESCMSTCWTAPMRDSPN